jgi:hypothetical protein
VAVSESNPDVVYAGTGKIQLRGNIRSGSATRRQSPGSACTPPIQTWKRIYAIVEAPEGAIFRSDDGGATWSKVNDERRFRQRAFYYTRIHGDPKERDTLYVLNTGFYRSTDGGKTWKSIRVPHGDNHDLWIAPNDPRRMINGNDGGAKVSTNGGESWTAQAYATAQMYHVITTAHAPYHVCGAQQDNSTACVPGNGTGNDFYDVGGGESGRGTGREGPVRRAKALHKGRHESLHLGHGRSCRPGWMTNWRSSR